MKGWLGCGVVVVLVVTGVVVAGMWVASVYHGLVREQIEVEARWTRIENAYQHRVDLATQLKESLRLGTDGAPVLVAPLSEACERAAEIVLSPEILEQPQRLREFETLWAMQSASIADALEALGRRSDLLSSRSVAELRDQLLAAERRLASEGESFNEAARRYNDVLRPFPTSMIARLFHFGPRPLLAPAAEATAATAAPPVLDESPHPPE